MEESKNKEKNKLFKDFKVMFVDNGFTPDDAAKGLLLFLVFETLVSLLYQSVYFAGATGEAWSFVFNILLDISFLVAVYIVAKNRKRNPIAEVKLNKKVSWLYYLLCLATSVVCIFGFSALTNCFLEVLHSFGYQSVSADIVIPNVWMYLLYTLTICIIPAFCEEVLFRGLIFTGLKKINNVVGVLGSAFIFMIMHGGPDQTVHQFILGIILALSFLLTGTIWVPIVIHFFNNFIAVTYSFIASGDTAADTAASTEVVDIYFMQYLMYAIISTLVAACLIYLIFKGFSALNKKRKPEPEISVAEDSENVVRPNTIELVDADNIGKFSMATENDFNENGLGSNAELEKESKNKLTKQGKVILIICLSWLVIDWVLALIAGFNIGAGV